MALRKKSTQNAQNPKPNQNLQVVRTARMCAYDCTTVVHHTAHRTVLIIFCLLLQPIRWCLLEGRA